MSDPQFTPFDANVAEAPTFRAWPASDRSDLSVESIDEFARGFAEGQSLAETAFAQERQALHALAASLQALQPVEPHAIRQLILESVERLVGEIVGKTPVEREWLVEQVDRVVQVAGRVEDKKILWLLPDDLPLLQGTEIGIELRADSSIVPGSLRLELESGWIEHGRMVMLDALRASVGTETGQ
jgi:flagellar biosynthesis/type III secretory pathway protein FliH